ncbi:MAG TPA: DUF1801 domain-containing protein [Bosea sp. (in: a-proteobacteria)]|jgi:hypothetical protein|uniref:DUF1801 domain-containing protein n=1 Tax=Bosea sp. (in: a-proteobacteria) TaxID=1871050 RepID=UPI002E0FD26A|nr:DUF1801 domain-containing protein [Bosea sp. (in: a-proteobacteria)]
MQPGAPKADNPAEYLAQLDGWRLATVEALRKAAMAAAPLEERIKWTHLVYFANGPVLLIRAEAARVLFGFWRGKRLREIEPRLKPGGKFELATMVLREGDSVDPAIATRLVQAAVALNRELGDPSKPSA